MAARQNDKLEPSETIGAASKRGGASVGKVAAVGKKMTLSARVAALESDLAVVQHQLEKARDEQREAKSQLLLAVSDDQAERRETMLSDQGQEKIEVVYAEDGIESSMETTATQPNEETNVSIAEVEAPSPVNMILKEVHEAAFPSTIDRIIFTRALSGIASHDTSVRADAVRVIAGIRHKLSVKVIAIHMAREPSTRVRQECIKALTTLKAKEGVGAVERALSDEAASVRLAAVWGLYHLAGAERSGPALVRMLSDEGEGVRRRAATCIGWLGQEELAVKLLPLLADNSISVRQAVVEAMGKLHSRRVVSTLIEYLNKPETSPSLRKAILSALETITGKKMSEPFRRDKKSLQCLIERGQQWWKDELLGG
jgi:hypothetical protein